MWLCAWARYWPGRRLLYTCFLVYVCTTFNAIELSSIYFSSITAFHDISKQIQQRARIGKIFARWHLAITITTFCGGVVVCAYQRFCFQSSCSLFIFSLPLIFTLLAASIFSRHGRYEIFMFFFQRNSSPLFSIIRSSSFSVIHVSVNIKNNVEKDTTLLLFFVSK